MGVERVVRVGAGIKGAENAGMQGCRDARMQRMGLTRNDEQENSVFCGPLNSLSASYTGPEGGS